MGRKGGGWEVVLEGEWRRGIQLCCTGAELTMMTKKMCDDCVSNAGACYSAGASKSVLGVGLVCSMYNMYHYIIQPEVR